MEDTLKEIVELSDADYQTLANYGSVTVDGITIQYTPKISMYVTPDDTLEKAKEYTDEKVGEINENLDTKVNKTDATVDDTVTDGQYVSAVKQTNGVIEVTRTPLPDYSNTYEPIGAAAAAKAYADGLIAAEVQRADGAYDATGAASDVLGTVNDTADEVTVYGVKAYASGRLNVLESKLNTVSNVMDFVGAMESLPTGGDYQSGDVIVVTEGDDAGKEFVYDGEKWVEFGYSDALNAAIARLQEGKVDKVENEDLIATSEIARLADMSDGANKVEPSETNGNIKIDGVETTVYDDGYCVKLSDVTGDNANDKILTNIAAALVANDEILTNIADALVSFMPWYEGEVETT